MGNSMIHRSESIILTTIEVINDFGIQGVSTREIARRQGVSEATLFRHFKTKNDLLLAVLEFFSKYDSDLLLSAKIKSLKPLETISYCINSYAIYCENYPAITAIEQSYGIILMESGLSEKMKSIYIQRISFIKENIEMAQSIEEIIIVDSDLVADMIIGTFKAISLRWRVEEYGFSLSKAIKEALNIIFDNIKSK